MAESKPEREYVFFAKDELEKRKKAPVQTTAEDIAARLAGGVPGLSST